MNCSSYSLHAEGLCEIENCSAALLPTGGSRVLLLEITQTGTDRCHYLFLFFKEADFGL